MSQPEYEIRYDPYTGRQYYVAKEQRAQPQDITTVNGKAGAEAYTLGANSKALLLDSTQPVLWVKTTDGAGYPTLDGYDFSPHVEKTAEEAAGGMLAELDKRMTKIEKMLEVITHGRESDPAEAGGE